MSIDKSQTDEKKQMGGDAPGRRGRSRRAAAGPRRGEPGGVPERRAAGADGGGRCSSVGR